MNIYFIIKFQKLSRSLEIIKKKKGNAAAMQVSRSERPGRDNKMNTKANHFSNKLIIILFMLFVVNYIILSNEHNKNITLLKSSYCKQS